MEIVIIGTGNTASILGKKLKQAGHKIVQVFGRDSMAASKLAYELESLSASYWNIVYRQADIYIVAVSDYAIELVIKELQLPDKTIVHTAASVSKDILRPASAHFGVFYPLQSLKKQIHDISEFPIIIDASDEETLTELESLGHSISETVVKANDQERLKLHLAAVICNNFVNHLYALTESFCRAEGIDFSLLQPLILETAERVKETSPSELQTGPAVRNDLATIKAHLQLLDKYPELKKIYSLFTQSIYP